MHSPSTRLCSRWYCCGSAGLARLTASAIASAFQYERERDRRRRRRSAMIGADEAVADQHADGRADERQEDDEGGDRARRCGACSRG